MEVGREVLQFVTVSYLLDLHPYTYETAVYTVHMHSVAESHSWSLCEIAFVCWKPLNKFHIRLYAVKNEDVDLLNIPS